MRNLQVFEITMSEFGEFRMNPVTGETPPSSVEIVQAHYVHAGQSVVYFETLMGEARSPEIVAMYALDSIVKVRSIGEVQPGAHGPTATKEEIAEAFNRPTGAALEIAEEMRGYFEGNLVATTAADVQENVDNLAMMIQTALNKAK